MDQYMILRHSATRTGNEDREETAIDAIDATTHGHPADAPAVTGKPAPCTTDKTPAKRPPARFKLATVVPPARGCVQAGAVSRRRIPSGTPPPDVTCALRSERDRETERVAQSGPDAQRTRPRRDGDEWLRALSL